MRVCFFGYYKISYHTMFLKKTFESQNIEVIECREEMKNFKSLAKVYFKLWKKHRKLKYDFLVIPTPWDGIITFPLAKLCSKKPIIHATYMSLYDTYVNDRKLFKRNSTAAKILHIAEKIICKWSDIIITETNGIIDYFITEYRLDRTKFRRLFLSADEKMFPPSPVKNRNSVFKVLFFGSFIPLHGTDVIVKAAKLLANNKDVEINMCGIGQEKEKMEILVRDFNITNVKFRGYVEQNTLNDMIIDSDICLGIFDDGVKAQNVITNKVFQILSSRRSLITRESVAVNEINLENNKNCILIPPRNPEKLAEAILYLKNNPQKAKEIAENGHKLFVNNLSMDKIGKELKEILLDI